MNVSIDLPQAQTDNSFICIRLSGEFDALACTETRAVFEQFFLDFPGQVIAIDLEQVSFIDSSGIGAIVFLYKRMQETQGTLKLCGVQGQPEELMRLLRVDKAIDVSFVENVERAGE